MQKSIVFLYTNNKLLGREIKKIPFIVATQRIKYSGIDALWRCESLYTKIYETLVKEIKDDATSGKILCAHGLKEYYYNVHTTQSDLQNQYNPYQNSQGIFHRNR